jgi:hypothetical protein
LNRTSLTLDIFNSGGLYKEKKTKMAKKEQWSEIAAYEGGV